MKAINFCIRRGNYMEAESFNILLSEKPNAYGLYTGKIVDHTLTEIFSVTKPDLTDCVTELARTIHSIGQVINIHEIKPDDNTKQIIDKIKKRV